MHTYMYIFCWAYRMSPNKRLCNLCRKSWMIGFRYTKRLIRVTLFENASIYVHICVTLYVTWLQKLIKFTKLLFASHFTSGYALGQHIFRLVRLHFISAAVRNLSKGMYCSYLLAVLQETNIPNLIPLNNISSKNKVEHKYAVQA